MIAAIIILVVGAISSCVFIYSKITNYSLKTIFFKVASSSFFVALGIVCLCLNKEGRLAFKVCTIVGLSLGILGDLLIGFKYIVKSNSLLWIVVGSITFALGHVAYTIGLLNGFYIYGNTLYMVLPFIVPIAFVAIYLLIAKKAGVNFGKGMLMFAISYLYILSMMATTAICMTILHKFELTTLVMFFAGSIAFVVSDVMLTGSYFKPGKRSKLYLATCSVLYYAAQFLIAFSLLFVC